MDDMHSNGGAGRIRNSDGGAQVIDWNGYDRLWRAFHAIRVLAAVDKDVAERAALDHDATAAIAQYVRDDVEVVLNRSKPTDEAL